MSAALRASMVGLVLLNLGFVALVESARWTWLGPLFALALLSPLLVRCARFLVYRLIWNVGILATFGLLTSHVQKVGAGYLLEDGLLLAALCQVHLLCNLREAQKPDLLFFNSFIIAVVTSYLTPDFGYLMLFVLYGPLLIVALQLLVLERCGTRVHGRSMPRILWQGARRGGLVLAVTLLAFFFWPRDFERRGMWTSHLKFRSAGELMLVDFQKEVELGRKGAVSQSDEVVLRVHLLQGRAADVSSHWRGATQDRFDGTSWTVDPRAHCPEPWTDTGNGAWRRGDGRGDVAVEVERVRNAATPLFAPLQSRHFRPVSERAGVRLHPTMDLVLAPAIGTRRPSRYHLILSAPAGAPGGVTDVDEQYLAVHTRLDPDDVPRALVERSQRLRSTFPDDADPSLLVARMEQDVRSRHRYLLPDDARSAASLQEFVEDPEAGGHCEFFATELVLMLRLAGIPSRMVTGYRSSEWTADGRTLIVRARHAHAWTEVWDPMIGWYTVDPTPSTPATAQSGPGLLTRLQRGVAALWMHLTSFNQDARQRAIDGVRSLGQALLADVHQRPVRTFLAALFLLVSAVSVRQRRRRVRQDPAIVDYRRALRRLRLVPGPGETPREVLLRAQCSDRTAEQVGPLAFAVLQHEQSRYRSGGSRTPG